MPRPIHFEIHTLDTARAQKFYGDLFGWTFQKYDVGATEYWGITTGKEGEPGINGGLIKRMGQGPIDGAAINAYICTINVRDLDAAMARATELGGTIALPKMPIPGMGWLGYAKDLDGNIFGMMQEDPGAK